MFQKSGNTISIDRLSPRQPIRNHKKNSISQVVQTPKKLSTKIKAIPLFKWDEQNKQLKFCMDYSTKFNGINDTQKYKSLLRTGHAAIIMYIHHRSEENNYYFSKILNDKQLPLIDTSLQKGIYVWNNVMYNDKKNLLIYQMQCVISEQITQKNYKRQSINLLEQSLTLIHSDQALLKVACLLASHVIFIVNDDDDGIFEDVQFHYLRTENRYFKAQVLNIVSNSMQSIRASDWEKYFGSSFKSDIYLVSDFSSNVGGQYFEQIVERLQEWQTDLQMNLEKKQYKNIEIDFLTLLSLMQVIAKIPPMELTLSNLQERIYQQAIQKQVEYGRRDIINNYKEQLLQFCSGSQERTQEEVSWFLHNLRGKAQSQFCTQMQSFESFGGYEQEKKTMLIDVEVLESKCINFYVELFNNELEQRYSNVDMQSMMSYFTTLLEFKGYRGIKSQHLINFMKTIYQVELRNNIEQMQNEWEQEHLFESPAQQQYSILQKNYTLLTQKYKALTQHIDVLRGEVKNLKGLVEINSQIHEKVEMARHLDELEQETLRLTDEVKRRKNQQIQILKKQ